MDRLESGALMIGLAPAGWLLGVFFAGVEGYGLPLGILLLGTGLAGWGIPTERRFVAAAGLLVAAFGALVFYDGSFVGGLSPFAGFVFFAACIAAVFAVLAGVRPAQAACYGAMAFAGLLWVFAGFTSMAWQAGNLLLLVGGVLAALGALRDR